MVEKLYLIGKRDSYIIVAQLSPEFTAKLVDRWQELESKQAFQIPSTLSGALLLAAKQAERLEQQQVLIEQQKPAVEFHDTVCEAINAQSVEEVAKVLGTGRNRMFNWLREKGLFKNDNLPYQDYIDRQYFRVCYRKGVVVHSKLVCTKGGGMSKDNLTVKSSVVGMVIATVWSALFTNFGTDIAFQWILVWLVSWGIIYWLISSNSE